VCLCDIGRVGTLCGVHEDAVLVNFSSSCVLHFDPCELVVLKHNMYASGNGQVDVCRGTYMLLPGYIIHCSWEAHVRQTWHSRDGGGHMLQDLCQWQRMKPGVGVESEIVVSEDSGWYKSFDDLSVVDVQILGFEE